MRAFTCTTCGQLVFFHNTRCLRCSSALGIDPVAQDMVVVADPARRCLNAEIAACNWLVDTPGKLCASCRLTRRRPADDDHPWLPAFAVAETAKRRLVFQLLSLGLALEPRDETTGTGVAFDLLSSEHERVMTGHAAGVITLDLAESDDVHRERVRKKMSEPYRTVLGHFRHEVGHYEFTQLVGAHDLPEARALFGDETTDYQAALDRHYREGAPEGWTQRHISEYATMHPAEDWAETFAHYLHIRGTLQTAAAYRLRVDGPDVQAVEPGVIASDPEELDPETIEQIIDAWLPLSYALNAVNRSMGVDDLYPFVLRQAVIRKLGFVHRMVRKAADRGLVTSGGMTAHAPNPPR
jgi:hypothetical protein